MRQTFFPSAAAWNRAIDSSLASWAYLARSMLLSWESEAIKSRADTLIVCFWIVLIESHEVSRFYSEKLHVRYFHFWSLETSYPHIWFFLLRKKETFDFPVQNTFCTRSMNQPDFKGCWAFERRLWPRWSNLKTWFTFLYHLTHLNWGVKVSMDKLRKEFIYLNSSRQTNQH